MTDLRSEGDPVSITLDTFQETADPPTGPKCRGPVGSRRSGSVRRVAGPPSTSANFANTAACSAFLVWRDIKVRYAQTVLGVGWAILQPLLTMLIFTLIFGRLAGVPSDGVPYPVFALAALVPWTYFSTALTGASNSLVMSTNLITKVYFPRLMIPLAPVLAGLLDLAFGSLLLVVVMFLYGHARADRRSSRCRL